MAHRNQKIPRPDRHRRLASLSRLGGMELRRQTLLPPRRPGGRRGLLHAGRHPRSGRIRPCPAYRGDSRDRDAGAQRGGAGRLPRTLVQRQTLHGLRFLHRQRADVRIPRERALRGDRALPFGIYPYRRRRGFETGLAHLPRMCRPDASGGTEGCRRAAKLPGAPHRDVPRRQGPPPAGLGRDSPGRARARRHGHVVARHRGRDRRGQGRTPRRDGSLELLLPRFLPGRPHPRAGRRGGVPHPRAGLLLRPCARFAGCGCRADDPRRAGQPVVRARAHSRTCRTHDLAAPAGDCRSGVERPRTEGLRRLPRPRARRRGVDAAARIPPLRPEKCRRPPPRIARYPALPFDRQAGGLPYALQPEIPGCGRRFADRRAVRRVELRRPPLAGVARYGCRTGRRPRGAPACETYRGLFHAGFLCRHLDAPGGRNLGFG